MQLYKARQILQALANGVDPSTGHELPSGTVIERTDVVRALMIGVSSLEEAAVRLSRRQQLPRNIGERWSKQEVEQLIEERKADKPLGEIAASHGRTLRAIEARLEILGLISAEERMTADRFNSKDQPGASQEHKPGRPRRTSRKEHG